MPYVGSAVVLAVMVYTCLVAFAEWKRGNRLGGIGLVIIGLGVFGLGLYISFWK